MIRLRYSEDTCPSYMTKLSAGADLKARVSVLIPAGGRVMVPTGVWISEIEWNLVPPGLIPELQLRARSGLALKKGITMINGIGTIDADYRDEICALLVNHSQEDFTIERGERVAQLVLNFVAQIPGLPVGGDRTGGMGSTGTR